MTYLGTKQQMHYYYLCIKINYLFKLLYNFRLFIKIPLERGYKIVISFNFTVLCELYYFCFRKTVFYFK